MEASRPPLQRSLSTSSSASSIPPEVPKRMGSTRPPPPVVPPQKASVEVVRSNSMDRSHYQSRHELRLYPMDNNLANETFSLTSSGRHSHILSPTKEALVEHNLRLDGARMTPNTRELEELRARCLQMERTMRWWSECTANWRDKWSKVRAERNRLKDEVKRLSCRVEGQNHQIAELRNECERVKMSSAIVLHDAACQTSMMSKSTSHTNAEEDGDLTVTSADFLVPKCHSLSSDSGVNHSGSLDVRSLSGQDTDERLARFLEDALASSVASCSDNNMIKLRLDESLKTLEVERESKKSLRAEMECLQKEIVILESQIDELRLEKQNGFRELTCVRNGLQEQIRSLQMKLEDQTDQRGKADQVICHLREEVERLQSENAEEWGRRERLETEMHTVDRDNRKLKMQMDELRERNRKLTCQSKEQASMELTQTQTQLEQNVRELLELRHNHGRLKKSHAEKVEEMSHLQRRCDNNEKEIKRLRQRIDELKKCLGRAEDENDKNANTIRRLQRSHDELLSQAEGYQVQIGHLTSRLRALAPPTEQLLLRGTTLLGGHKPPFPDVATSREVSLDDDVDGDRRSPFSATSEESLPIFDEDEDDDDDSNRFNDASNAIETDV